MEPRYWARPWENNVATAGLVRSSRSGPVDGHARGPGSGIGHDHGLITRDLHISEHENSRSKNKDAAGKSYEGDGFRAVLSCRPRGRPPGSKNKKVNKPENSESKKRKQNNNNHDNSDAAGKSYEGDEVRASISRRRIGRPPGSKNKKATKRPVTAEQESGNALTAYPLDIGAGSDVAESLISFAQGWQRRIIILSGTGTVSNVILRPLAMPSTTVMLRGCYQIISLTGVMLPTPERSGTIGLTICLGGGRGEVVGGFVVGALLAASPVVVVAATSLSGLYQRLSLDGEGLQPHEGISQSAALTAAQQQLMPSRRVANKGKALIKD